MTPKEWAFVRLVVRDAMSWAYEQGHAAGATGDNLSVPDFSFDTGKSMQLKKELNNFIGGGKNGRSKSR